MTELSKEWREELRENMQMNPRAIESCDMPGHREMLELIDMADERDRYRALLEQAYVDGHHDGYCDAPIMWPGWDEDRAKESWEQSDVKAALEGNNDD